MAAACALAAPTFGQWAPWPTLGGDVGRTSLLRGVVATGMPGDAAFNTVPVPSGLPRWTRTTDEFGTPFSIPASTTPVCDASRVYALVRTTPPSGPAAWRVLAFDIATGATAWSAAAPTPVLDSYSSPAIDEARGIVIIASGTTVLALRTSDGGEAWRRTLPRAVVNASPVIVTPRDGRGRVLITDYDGFGAAGALHCINLDPFAAHNPFAPGQIVWSVTIGGTSGATPSILRATDAGLAPGADLVYVATLGDPGFEGGTIQAFPVDADAPPVPTFVATNPVPEGFFGAISVAPAPGPGLGPRVYAASYAFFGGVDSANLIAVDALTGELLWSIPANRSSSAPVVLGTGRIVLSAGIQGFGSVPSVSLFVDRGDGALRLWDSALDSWIDADTDFTLDAGEYLRVGSWSFQPVASRDLARLVVGVGPLSGVSGAQGAGLATVDLALRPRSRGFLSTISGVSGSVAVTRHATLAHGFGPGGLGLAAFDAPRADVSADGAVTVDDVYAFERAPVASAARDVDGDGVAIVGVLSADRAALLRTLRVNEGPRMSEGRP